ncbi:hypothetical protein GRI99_01345 [Altererythrobacter buctensis]|uniref:NERD domain-containing protein n=2 Tax=Alteraurantiacibacter buctensis TaxID=1503981 RepID=A0A844YPG7_9SPHN|nr:hypothetical protein [Alteraurantiacibacter buctensis]
MDAFEQLAADIFWAQGYWVRTGVKVELTRDEKLTIGRHSSPRWEVDLLAWSTQKNELLVLECKSYFDSGGVHAAHFLPGSKYAHRYKLFHDQVLRETVLERLRLQCLERGLCSADAQIRLGLVHGHVTRHNAARLQAIFEQNDWLLFGPQWARRHLAQLAAGSYDNSTAAVVAKLLLRPHQDEASEALDG